MRRVRLKERSLAQGQAQGPDLSLTLEPGLLTPMLHCKVGNAINEWVDYELEMSIMTCSGCSLLQATLSTAKPHVTRSFSWLVAFHKLSRSRDGPLTHGLAGLSDASLKIGTRNWEPEPVSKRNSSGGYGALANQNPREVKALRRQNGGHGEGWGSKQWRENRIGKPQREVDLDPNSPSVSVNPQLLFIR